MTKRPPRPLQEGAVPDPLQVRVGANLRAARLAKGLTQVQVAERSGIAQPTVSAIELGHYNLTLKQIARLAAVVGCDASDLVQRVPPPD